MSGIAGIIHFDGRPVEPGLVEGMTAAMAHRGPDGIHHWRQGAVALGQCMLRTTPESLEERQPLANEDESLVLVMDGRVDNWEELRRDLLATGAVLRTRADAELVLRAYERWGRDCLQHIDGDFALVIWDERRKEAFCARDRVGNKPFHYHWDGRTLTFASEVHAILALPWVPEELNEGMVAEFLGYEWISRDETFWKGVQRLVAACRMSVRVSGLQIEQYWEPDVHATLPCRTDGDYAHYYRELLTDIVRRMSRTHRSLACEVSGGLDSSALFALAARLQEGRTLLAPALDGYTLAFHGAAGANDLPYARSVGEHLQRLILEVEPASPPLSWYQEQAKRFRSFPPFPNGAIGLGIREMARWRESKALMVGVGGDQWLCGSRDYYADFLAGRNWHGLRSSMAIDRRNAGLGTTMVWLGRHGLLRLLPDRARQVLQGTKQFFRQAAPAPGHWLVPELREALAGRRTKGSNSIEQGRFTSRELRATLVDAYGALANELEESLASITGVELRRPYYSHRLVDAAFSIPAQLMLRGKIDKFLHRVAMRELLPAAVLERSDKAVFSITFLRYAEELKQLRSTGILERSSGWVDKAQAVEFFEEYSGGEATGRVMWSVWSLMGCDALVQAGQPSEPAVHT